MIRSYRLQDTDKLLNLWFDSVCQGHPFIDKLYWAKNIQTVKDEYRPRAQTFVFEDRKQIKGFISLMDNYIGALFVAPKFQRQKIGKKLLEYVRRRRPNLTLEVYSKNLHALRFYQKSGFKLVSVSCDDETKEEKLTLSWGMGCKSGFHKRFPSDS